MTRVLATFSGTTPALKGIGMARINGAFGSFAQYKEILKKVKAPVIIDLPGDRKKPRHMTARDEEILDFAVENEIEYAGISYVETAWDVDIVKAYAAGRPIKIISKIETKKALSNLDSILNASDGIMIDRQDLATAVGLEKVPRLQKIILRKAREAGKLSIVASELMISMVKSASPTRAEASDVANAALDGADFVMFSEETAIGKHPQAVVSYAGKIIGDTLRKYKAVILAAGTSSGLGGLTADRHQCLLDCGGESIIEHQLSNLNYCGIPDEDVVMVIGKGHDKIRQALADRNIEFVYNPWFATSNMLVSLWLARNHLPSSFITLYGDIVFDRQILKGLLKAKQDIALAVDKKACDEEDEKICVKDARMTLSRDYEDLPMPKHKTVPLKEAYGEFIGMAKFSRMGRDMLFDEVEQIVHSGNLGAYLVWAFERLAKKGKGIHIIDTQKALWCDNDTLDDFKKIRKVIYPKIKKRYNRK